MTTRDPDALQIQKWAATGDVATPESTGLTRATGWPLSYSQVGGDTPSREVFNQMFREITGMLDEINTKGILPWDPTIAYEHPAYVIREVNNNPRIFESLRDNTNSDPATHTDWISPVPQAGAYAAQLHSLPSTLTDFDDIDTTLFVPAQSEVVWFHDNINVVDNRPFGLPVNQRFQCLLIRSVSQSQLVLKAFPVNRNNTNVAGITCFERYSNDNGQSWTQWGSNATLASMFTDRADINDPFIRRSSNVSALARSGVGHFTITVPIAPPIDFSEGYPTGFHATAYHSGAFRSAQIINVSNNATSGLDVEIQVYDNNTAQQNPTALSVTIFMHAV